MREIKELKAFSYKNKKRDVKAESIFRAILQNSGIHYQRQKVIDRYIVDFYFPKRNLIVEIDEKYHDQQQERDARRQRELEGHGYVVVRFKDVLVFNDPSACIAGIMKFPEDNKLYRECKQRLAVINSRKTQVNNNS